MFNIHEQDERAKVTDLGSEWTRVEGDLMFW